MNNKWWAIAVSLAFGYAGVTLASGTLRVGSQVISTGDSATRVIALLGKPSRKFHARAAHAGSRSRSGVRVISANDGGERWQYRRGDHVTTISIIDGRVGNIEDRRQ